ncbi:MAG: hypothetical protein MUP03_01640 [Anaerolineales bacterium]|nr:hypothetical protein [Anaerolineales bacterium]
MANISGQTLGRYKILEVLGEGRMASQGNLRHYINRQTPLKYLTPPLAWVCGVLFANFHAIMNLASRHPGGR